MKLPRWGSRVRIPSSAPQRGPLTCDYVEVPGTGASFLDGYSHESPTKSCRGGVGVHPGLAKKASKGEWTGGTPPFGYLYSQNVWVPRVRIEVLDPFGPERHSRTARSCSADAGTARSLGRQTGCRSSIAARRAAGLAHFRLHDLRHLMATEMLAAGVPSPTVSQRLSHARASTTLSVYAHSVPGGDRKEAEAFAAILAACLPEADPSDR